jgi:membrane-associated phospholipid phosphatase
VQRHSLTRWLGFILAAKVAAGLFIAVSPASAQSTAPYALDTRKEFVLSAAGAGLLAAGFAVQQGQEPLTQADIDALDAADVNAFDRPATEQWSTSAADASDILVLSVLASPLILAAGEARNGHTVTLTAMYAETLLLSNGVLQLLKGVTSRTRPFPYNDDPAVPEEPKLETSARRSFPSGHTANAFTAAVFLSTTYSRLHPNSAGRTWVWAGSLAAAGSVGYLRYRAGKHFPTDVIAGALIGASLGYLVPKLHETNTVYVAPSARGLAVGAVLKL